MCYLFDLNIINIDIQFNIIILFRILNSNKLDLLTIRDNLLILNSSKSIFKLGCILVFRSVIDLSEKNQISSSANNTGLHELDMFGNSLMYNTNNSGPKTEPCGTPHAILLIF